MEPLKFNPSYHIQSFQWYDIIVVFIAYCRICYQESVAFDGMLVTLSLKVNSKHKFPASTESKVVKVDHFI